MAESVLPLGHGNSRKNTGHQKCRRIEGVVHSNFELCSPSERPNGSRVLLLAIVGGNPENVILAGLISPLAHFRLLRRLRGNRRLLLLCVRRQGKKNERAHDQPATRKRKGQEPRRANRCDYQVRSLQVNFRIDASRVGGFLISAGNGVRFWASTKQTFARALLFFCRRGTLKVTKRLC